MTVYLAGSAKVSIVPDMSGFQDKIKAQFAEEGDDAGKAFSSAFQDQLKASFADLPDATIKADADTAAAAADLDAAAKTRTADIKVNVDKSSLAQAKTDLAGISDSASKLVPSTTSLAALGGLALGPQAAGAALGVAGIGVAFGSAAVDAGAFGVVAKGMFADVTTAQKALTTAQQAYAKADNSADRAKALAAEKAATDGLTASEKLLLTQVTALESGWKKLTQAEQPVVESALTPWLQTATQNMQLLTPLIDDGAGAIQLLGTETESALKSPFWSTFTNTLGTTGQIALTNFGEAAGEVGDGLAHLFVTFAPDIDNLLTDIPTLAGYFDNWAKSVTSGGLEDFFTKTFSHANLQTLGTDLDSVGKFFTTVGTATESMSPLAFNGLQVVLEAIGELPPDAVIALTAMFLATKTIGSVASIASLVSSLISLGSTGVSWLAGLFGNTAAATTEAEAAGTAAGDAAGTAFDTSFDATSDEAWGILETEGETSATAGGTAMGTAAGEAFGTSFGTTSATALATALTGDDAAGDAEATTAGTAWGTAAATAFGAAFGTEAGVALTTALTADDAAGTAAATAGGTAMGTAAATAFAASFEASGAAEVGTELAADLAGAVLGVTLAGGALGLAAGTGFKAGFSLSGASGAAGGLENSVKSATAAAGTWLTPAGQQAATGFATGFTSQAAKVQAAAAEAKTWMTAGTNGSSAWLTTPGQQTATGFQTGFTSAHAAVNTAAAQLKTWVTDALPSNSLGAMLIPGGIALVQGLINGVISMGSALESAIIDLIPSSLRSTVSAVLGIPGFATGTPSAPSGWAWVGEQGPELVKFSGGEQVKTNAASLSMAALSVPSISAGARLPGVSSPLSAGPLQLQLSYVGSGNAVTDAIVGGLQGHIQGQYGGDVQAALGRGGVRLQ